MNPVEHSVLGQHSDWLELNQHKLAGLWAAFMESPGQKLGEVFLTNPLYYPQMLLHSWGLDDAQWLLNSLCIPCWEEIVNKQDRGEGNNKPKEERLCMVFRLCPYPKRLLERFGLSLAMNTSTGDSWTRFLALNHYLWLWPNQLTSLPVK